MFIYCFPYRCSLCTSIVCIIAHLYLYNVYKTQTHTQYKDLAEKRRLAAFTSIKIPRICSVVHSVAGPCPGFPFVCEVLGVSPQGPGL